MLLLKICHCLCVSSSNQEEKCCATACGHSGQLQDWTTIFHHHFDQRPPVCGWHSWWVFINLRLINLHHLFLFYLFVCLYMLKYNNATENIFAEVWSNEMIYQFSLFSFFCRRDVNATDASCHIVICGMHPGHEDQRWAGLFREAFLCVWFSQPQRVPRLNMNVSLHHHH